MEGLVFIDLWETHYHLHDFRVVQCVFHKDSKLGSVDAGVCGRRSRESSHGKTLGVLEKVRQELWALVRDRHFFVLSLKNIDLLLYFKSRFNVSPNHLLDIKVIVLTYFRLTSIVYSIMRLARMGLYFLLLLGSRALKALRFEYIRGRVSASQTTKLIVVIVFHLWVICLRISIYENWLNY